MGSVVDGSRGSSQELRGWEVWWSGGLEVVRSGGMEVWRSGAGDTFIGPMEEEQEGHGGGARGQPEAGQGNCIRSIIYY